MSTLKSCNPKLKSYLMKHRLPDIFESLITALAVNRPADARQFIIDKISELLADKSKIESLRWDTFIEEEKKPKHRFGSKFFDFLWSYEDENSQWEIINFHINVFTDVFVLMSLPANYGHVRKSLQFLQSEVNENMFQTFVRSQKKKENIFMNKVRRVVNTSLLRLIFGAWKHVTMDSRKTREYFEKLERGEIPEGPQTSSDGKDHISNFPRKIAILIFSYVDLPDLIICSQVCRTWKIITQSTILWSRIDLTKLDKRISSKATSSLVHKCRPFLCHLNLRAMDNLTPKSLKTIGECRNLQDLNISFCKGVTDDVIKEIAIGCASLLYLNMSNCHISDAALRSLSRNCNNIQFLNLSFCANFTNKGLHYLSTGKGCQRLLFIDLSGCCQITEAGFAHLAKGCNRIGTLILNSQPTLKDEHIQAFMSGCKNLKYFSAMNSPLLTDMAVKSLCGSKKLQVIELEGNSRITDSAVRSLVKCCPELKRIHLVDCERLTDLSLKALSQSKNVTVANIADCIRLSDTGVRYVVEGASGTKLRELNLTNCLRVSDVSVLRIAQRCFSLTYINLSYCEHVTDAGVELLGTILSLISVDLSGCLVQDQGIAALGNNTRFKDIVISGCSSITDIGIQKLVQQTRSLENFDVSDCKLISDHAIKSLAFCCRRLRTLNISGCRLLTDASLQYLSGVCHFIDSLDLSNCGLISDRALRFLRKGCRNLKNLSIRNCRGISKGLAQKMASKVQNVFHGFDDPPLFESVSTHVIKAI
eukprot:gene6047-6749_t